MKLIGAASIGLVLALGYAASGRAPGARAEPIGGAVSQDDETSLRDGQAIFRFDTFGDEQLWTDVLRMHEAVATVTPETALAVGLKVDVDALPPQLIAALRAGLVDLTSPAVTVALLGLDAVVGLKGTVNGNGQLTALGITCALCHSSVDDSFAPGIGQRLDGYANTDLDVGVILALSPVLEEEAKAEFRTWGPGMYDPRHHYFDGTRIRGLNSPSRPIVIPPVYGLRGVGFETVTGDGAISYWNSYVGVGQMGGRGTFSDPRLGIVIVQSPDLVTPKLPALLQYQLSLRSPSSPQGSFDRQAANRGKDLFRNEAGCATCHQLPNFTDVLSGRERSVPVLHAPSEVGMDPEYAERSATGKYRTTPLRGLFLQPRYFHDGSATDLLGAVDHYDRHFGLDLTAAQKADLVEYLKSL